MSLIKGRENSMISKRIYFTITVIFLIVFVLFMFSSISTELVKEKATNKWSVENIHITYEDTLSSDLLNMDNNNNLQPYKDKLKVAILIQDKGDNHRNILEEWCIYNKYLYKLYSYLPASEEIKNYDLILFGNMIFTREDSKTLYDYGDLGKTMIFTELPDNNLIEADEKLADFLGIETIIEKNVMTDGIKIFSDLMIGGERVYHKDDYFGKEDDTTINVPYYRLRAGYEVYSVGLIDKQKELGIEDKELPPLLWRTRTKESFVFVINSHIFDETSLLGVLTGFMAHENECYLYPIVNAHTISLVDYPYFSEENNLTIKQLYSRNSNALSRDILWPNIIQILKNYGGSFNFFAASELDYADEVDPNGDYIDFYLGQIKKLPGELGISLGQVSDADLKDILDKNYRFFNENIPQYYFTALFLAKFNENDIKEYLNHKYLENISLIMSDYNQGDRLIEFLNKDVLSVKFNLDGYQHETLDDIQMKSVNNALGMCNMKVDIGRAIFPKDSSDEWNNLSLEWSKGDTYFKNFSKFDMVSIYDMEKRVRRFLALDFKYEYNNNSVIIHIENFDEEAYFILSVYDKKIEVINNGSATYISNNTYLIKASSSKVEINLLDKNLIKKPENNQIICFD